MGVAAPVRRGELSPAARLDGRSDEEALRSAVAAGTASTLELGAGRFEQRESGRLLGSVEVAELEPAARD